MTGITRIKRDYLHLKRNPVPYITVEPLPSNLLECHYVIEGPENSPYHGGYYHGRLLFPQDFPFKPPSIYMLTPNGRFKTDARLCLSISDYHSEKWNPTWSVATILTGFLSFMLQTSPTFGSVQTTLFEKQQYAKKSLAFNLKNCTFCELFPQICDEINERLQKQQQLLEAITLNQFRTSAGDNDGSTYNNDCNDSMAGTNKLDYMLDAANSNQNPRPAIFNNWQEIYFDGIAIISFAIFALIVNYVMTNIN